MAPPSVPPTSIGNAAATPHFGSASRPCWLRLSKLEASCNSQSEAEAQRGTTNDATGSKEAEAQRGTTYDATGSKEAEAQRGTTYKRLAALRPPNASASDKIGLRT